MNILSNEPLQGLNSLSLCANGQSLVTVSCERELTDALLWAQQRKQNVTVFGAGSNVVLAGDIAGLIVVQQSSGIEYLSENDDTVELRVSAGENWHKFAAWCLKQGFYGLENLALIPGTVGAAPIQNIGAYGVEIQSFINAVNARRISDLEEIVLSRSDCQFSYRDSIFKHALRDQLAITSVDFHLSKTQSVRTEYPALAKELERKDDLTATAQEVFDAVVRIRSSKLPDPAMVPNAGSFFKNPILSATEAQRLISRYEDLPVYAQADGRVKFPAAWFIDQCGWKGYQENGLGVHPEHALVLVNYGGDSGKDLLLLAEKIAHSVRERFEIKLEQEPRTYGGLHE